MSFKTIERMDARGTHWRRLVAGLATALMLAAGIVAASPSQPAEALSGSEFDPGYIITDQLFYDGGAMTQAQIQSFLEAMEPGSCTNGYCLKNYSQSVASRARAVSDSTGQVRCEAFTGGTLSAAAIIYRAQVACGISAKVILVTLQKEQLLVTKLGPSKAAMDRAMGFACPDTAPCASYALGFANQIYMGTMQLKTYKASNFGMKPGVRNIQWHPNSACGSSNVNVQNYATAALYNYTPYRPNAAALANLYGTGDSCSSYGNRNFWVIYSNWFGNPLYGRGQLDLVEKYTEVGGYKAMGVQLASITCSARGTSCEAGYANGNIYWTIGYGAYVVKPPVLKVYLGNGGPAGSYGWPKSDDMKYAGGSGQSFEGASIYSSTAGTFAVPSVLRDRYFSRGGSEGRLGYPTGPAKYVSQRGGGWTQPYNNGSIYVTTAGVDDVVMAPLADEYTRVGGPAGIGWPYSETLSYTENGGGAAQSFQLGSIYSSTAGTHTVAGTVRAAYFKLEGAAGKLGWPSGDRTCGLAGNGCSQPFTSGTLYTGSLGTHVVTPQYDAVYAANGGTSGPMGWPYSGLIAIPQNGGGTGQSFANASIYSSTPGTFVVSSDLRAKYFKQGGSAGALGWPTAAAVCTDATCTQTFQGGKLSAPGGAAAGLGSATSAVITIPQNGGGTGQTFQKGSVYISSAGAFAVKGPIRTNYWSSIGSAGWLGWPTSAQTCAATCSQTFQNGVIYSDGNSGRSLTAKYNEVYVAHGGPTGALGFPKSQLIMIPQNGAGSGQSFMTGSIYSSASGIFAVVEPLRTRYFAKNGSAGPLGWPLAEQVCAGSTCTQQFQKGSL